MLTKKQFCKYKIKQHGNNEHLPVDLECQLANLVDVSNQVTAKEEYNQQYKNNFCNPQYSLFIASKKLHNALRNLIKPV